jgi:hypothetical protein
MNGLFNAIVGFGSKAIGMIKGETEETNTEVGFDIKVKSMIESCNYSKS